MNGGLVGLWKQITVSLGGQSPVCMKTSMRPWSKNVDIVDCFLDKKKEQKKLKNTTG